MKILQKIIPIACSGALLISCSNMKQNKSDVTSSEKGKTTTFDVNYLDKSVRPQDDFFQFSNGTWVKNNPIPSTESRWGSFNELEQTNMTKLTAIMEDLSQNKKGDNLEAYLGNYYASFMDKATRNDISWKVIAPDLDAVKNMKTNADIPALVANQHKNGVRSLFSFSVYQDLKDIRKNITYLEQSGLGLPNKNYYSDADKQSILDQYEKHVFKSFSLIGYSTSESKKAARNVVDLETKLAKGMMTPSELRIPEDSYNKMNIAEFQNAIPNFNFEKYLKEVGSLSFKETK